MNPAAMPCDPGASLAAAIARLEQGNLAAAELGLRDILRRFPGNFDATHLLGLCLHQSGQHAAADAQLGAAVRIEPHNAAAHFNRGNARRALQQHAAALESYTRACELAPALAVAQASRALTLLELGRSPDALAHLDHCAAQLPATADLLCIRAYCLQQLARNAEALQAYVTAIALDPSCRDAHLNRGALLQFIGRPAEAADAFERALVLDPSPDFALYGKGAALLDLNAFGAAAACLESYLQHHGDDARAWNDLGLARKGLDQLPAAAEAFERAIALAPGFDRALANLGNVRYRLGHYTQARASYEQALAIDPANALSRWNLGLCRLLLGDWPGAWQDYEARWSQTGHALFAPREFFDRPWWRGDEPLVGRTIFLHAEQGLGDTLQFCRYALVLAQHGARVVLEVPPALQGLLERSLGSGIRVMARGQAVPEFDYHCPLLSVPNAVRTTLETIPADLPYLRADPERHAAWEQRLGQKHRPRIALVWSSGVSDPRRDVALERLQTLGAASWDFIGVQTQIHDSDRTSLAAFPGLRWYGGELRDFDDTAALLGACDAVVSVDTSVAHLAGALGLPLLVLLPFAPDWRWQLQRDDSPWYPGARLFRQRVPGRWDEPVAALASHLAGMLAST